MGLPCILAQSLVAWMVMWCLGQRSRARMKWSASPPWLTWRRISSQCQPRCSLLCLTWTTERLLLVFRSGAGFGSAVMGVALHHHAHGGNLKIVCAEHRFKPGSVEAVCTDLSSASPPRGAVTH